MKRFHTIILIGLLVGVLYGCKNEKLDGIQSIINENNDNYIDSSYTVNSLVDNGFKLIEEQSFLINMENWGDIRLVSGYYIENGVRELRLYLCDQQDNILYELPNFYGNKWIFYGIKDISFSDINKDGLKDIIVLADYIVGHGENATETFPVGSIYFQYKNLFISIPELNQEINKFNFNNIDKILEFVEGRDIKLSR